ncbi:AraC family transcriptional regulator [Neptuniibacter pectenicola]|uniref:AraC family transcriptional regulator n=1 Tax=Neptuniibacter pectenicola TaxID=1806669 RepID=UPI0008310D05|nr:AraC family transcriptional regulator [Neptuniibacter pectenicola]
MKQSNLMLELRSYSSENHSHHHDYHQLVLPVVGGLSMSVGCQEGEVSSQQIAVIAAGQEHGFAAPDQNLFVVADVPAVLTPELDRLPAFIKLDAALVHYVSFLHNQLKKEGVSRSTERQMLLLLIQLLHERFGEALNLDRRIDVARNYLDKHFHERVSHTQLAAIANLSARQLSELFRRQLGMTPQQYLTEKRMQQAWRLLERGELSIQKIADQVGYRSAASFSDRFRKHFDHPPSYFRQIGK